MKLQPIKDRVCIKSDEAVKQIGSIFVPDSAKKKQEIGTVLSCGPECVTVKKGDRVLYGRYAGSEIHLDNNMFLLVKEEDILCVLNE